MKKRAHNEIPEPTLRRLPWYLAHLELFRNAGQQNVSSTSIALGIGLAPALVAKDLSYLDLKGKTRVGYNVASVVNTLEDFLGFNQKHNAYVFGVGNLGAALIADKGLDQFGLDIKGGFDIVPERVNTEISGTPIYHLNELKGVIAEEKHPIAVLTVPVSNAQGVTDFIVEQGIKAIWNFTPSRIHVPKGVVVQNTSLYAHLAVMFNRMKGL